MQWTALTRIDQLAAIDTLSNDKPVLLLKHSTQCSLSAAALDRLEEAWTTADDAARTAFYLDLLSYRAVSNAIAEHYGIEHESPQVLVIRNGRCVYHTSHRAISYPDTIAALDAAR